MTTIGTTLTATSAMRNVAPGCSTERDARHSAAQPLNCVQPARTDHLEREAESPMQNKSVLNVLAGFLSLDEAGDFIRWNGCILDASDAMKVDPRVARIERCSDDAVMYFRRRKAKAHRYEEAKAA